MRLASHIISYLFHPIFIIIYSLLLIFISNPYVFTIQNHVDKVIILTLITMLTVGFPLLAIFLIRFLGLNKDMNMTSQQERIIPLIITAMFYLWLYINIRSNTYVPLLFSSFVLGATFGIFISFFINNFSKISLHTVGMGGLVAMIFILYMSYGYSDFILNLGFIGMYRIHLSLCLILGILLAGLVGTARLYITDHTKSDIYGGYLVGLASQLLAYLILF